MAHDPVFKDGDGEEPTLDEYPITIFLKDGMVTEVQYNDVPVRARVCNYDVDFPCPAAALSKDSEGKYYMDIIV